MKYQERLLAIKMRRRGKSYKEIRKVITVSKATLSVWLRDVRLTEKQKKRLYVTLRQQNGYRLAKRNQEEKKARKINTTTQARKEVLSLVTDPLFLSGVMLYWAEGDKSEETEDVKFSNSSPDMIRLMVRWFVKYCKVPKEKLRIALHIHELHNRRKIEKYWSDITGIPLSQFHKTQIKPTSLGHRKNRLYNGTCCIRVSNKTIFRKIQGWKLGLIEHLL
ncbi:MAG: hypothetical protein A3J66_04345 [Candidatus Magasanikbacteria bacterium RIFCSPHIGHO2_02_FULL_47_14]|uniref:Uncharacterized protein n=1 Tax=Candidatus Magasanikbacteria bacterium RIFCSPHIGHO2_02_FULL_47_14 TaxID=1798680 RepID=A0A1F6M4G1_9BACT|nr:MAG: hypothetical protein A3J66_04345 [Candidatus Magasanikbacteria bacterium RIFCSPHIGHO2_02_FULL_47_14]